MNLAIKIMEVITPTAVVLSSENFDQIIIAGRKLDGQRDKRKSDTPELKSE